MILCKIFIEQLSNMQRSSDDDDEVYLKIHVILINIEIMPPTLNIEAFKMLKQNSTCTCLPGFSDRRYMPRQFEIRFYLCTANMQISIMILCKIFTDQLSKMQRNSDCL